MLAGRASRLRSIGRAGRSSTLARLRRSGRPAVVRRPGRRLREQDRRAGGGNSSACRWPTPGTRRAWASCATRCAPPLRPDHRRGGGRRAGPEHQPLLPLVLRAGRTARATRDRFGDLDGPRWDRPGSGSSPARRAADLLARMGLFAHVQPYHLVVDTQGRPAGPPDDRGPGRRPARRRRWCWGPIAGYWAKQQPVPLSLAPLKSDPRTGAAVRLPHLDGHPAGRAGVEAPDQRLDP